MKFVSGGLMKKFLCLVLSIFLVLNRLAVAAQNVETKFTKATTKEYKQKTVSKHYDVYNLKITNKNNQPILLTTDTDVSFTLGNGAVVTSENRRTMYRHVRKRDMGRYYWFALPGAAIAGAVTGITFFIGAPIGFAIYVGMYVPTDKAVRTNVKISQDLFNENVLPIRMEPEKTYNVRVFAPKNQTIKKVTISNVSFDLDKKFDLNINTEDL